MGCATLKHNVRSIAREASAAPAAKFKSASVELFEALSPFGRKTRIRGSREASLYVRVCARSFEAGEGIGRDSVGF
jgi:hypothetical protein